MICDIIETKTNERRNIMSLLKLSGIGKIYYSEGNVAVGIRGIDLVRRYDLNEKYLLFLKGEVVNRLFPIIGEKVGDDDG